MEIPVVWLGTRSSSSAKARLMFTTKDGQPLCEVILKPMNV